MTVLYGRADTSIDKKANFSINFHINISKKYWNNNIYQTVHSKHTKRVTIMKWWQNDDDEHSIKLNVDNVHGLEGLFIIFIEL